AMHHLKLSVEQIKRIFQETDYNFSGTLEYDGFAAFYYKIANYQPNRPATISQPILDTLFHKYSRDGKTISVADLQCFFATEQKVNLNPGNINDIVFR